MPKQSKIKLKGHKISSELALCWPDILWFGDCPGVWLIYPVTLHWRKLFFLLPSGVASRSLCSNGRSFCLPLLSADTQSSFLYRSYVCSHCLCVFICLSVLLCMEDNVSESSITSDLYLFCLLIPLNFLAMTEGGVWWRYQFRTKCSTVSHFLHTFSLGISFLIIIYFKKKLLWWGLSNVLTCGYWCLIEGFSYPSFRKKTFE